MKQKQKKIWILLTRLPGSFSSIVTLCTGSYYTHVSLGFEEDRNTFYSFVLKGFIVEKIDRYCRKENTFPCRLYELEVNENVYSEIRQKVEIFEANKKNLHYTKLGVLLGFMHILLKWENHYYCSQFVGEVLKEAKAVKKERLFMPKDFITCTEMNQRYQGNLSGMLQQFNSL